MLNSWGWWQKHAQCIEWTWHCKTTHHSMHTNTSKHHHTYCKAGLQCWEVHAAHLALLGGQCLVDMQYHSSCIGAHHAMEQHCQSECDNRKLANNSIAWTTSPSYISMHIARQACHVGKCMMHIWSFWIANALWKCTRQLMHITSWSSLIIIRVIPQFCPRPSCISFTIARQALQIRMAMMQPWCI